METDLSIGRCLGPFVSTWMAWSKTWDIWKSYPDAHFAYAIEQQLEELDDCDDDHKAKELVDIMSITLNWMRQLGLTPEEIAQAVMNRARTRYNNTEEILVKYEAMRADAEA